jgi:hypothetical protein
MLNSIQPFPKCKPQEQQVCHSLTCKGHACVKGLDLLVMRNFWKNIPSLQDFFFNLFLLLGLTGNKFI